MIKLITSLVSRPYGLQTRNLAFFADVKPSQQFIEKFTQLQMKKGQNQQSITNGRAWRAAELRLKSNEDLHKLWYVCVREKNILLADKVIEMKINRSHGLRPRIDKVTKTMRRILNIIIQRQKIRKKYREYLEEQYMMKKKAQLEQTLKEKDPLPQITWEMLRTKYLQLKKGVDSTKYLERIWNSKDEYAQRKARMNERLQNKPSKFKSFWEYEMGFEDRPLQQEVLRTHIANWKSLNLKQRKIILGFLNARRSKDAKTSFIKQLKILGQKIAYDQTKSRIKEE